MSDEMPMYQKTIGRRKLFQALSMIAIAPAAKALPIGGKHFIIFFDAVTMDAAELATREYANIPSDAIIELVPMKLRSGQTVEEAVKVYEIEGWQ